jgi:hypothetical protein
MARFVYPSLEEWIFLVLILLHSLVSLELGPWLLFWYLQKNGAIGTYRYLSFVEFGSFWYSLGLLVVGGAKWKCLDIYTSYPKIIRVEHQSTFIPTYLAKLLHSTYIPIILNQNKIPYPEPE